MTDTSATTPEPVAPLSDWEMKAVAQAKLEAELFTLNKGALLNALALAGVTRVVVSFDGYGDSGQIENVEAQAGDDPVAMPARSHRNRRGRLGSSRTEAFVRRYRRGRREPGLRRSRKDPLRLGEQRRCLRRRHLRCRGGVITLDYNERYTASENYTHTF